MPEARKSLPADKGTSRLGTLLWTAENVRAMAEQRLYPAYVGSRDASKGSAKSFPVLVWPEQNSVIESASAKSPGPNEGKRRRAEDKGSNSGDASINGSVDEPSSKKSRHSERIDKTSKAKEGEEEGKGGLWSGLVQPVWNWLRGFAQSALSTVLEEEEGEGEEEEYGSSCCSSSGQDCCKSTAALREDVVVSNGDVSISNCAAAIATTAPSRSDVTDEEKLFKDLHSRGYCVGPGSAYGGTYCIYDGSPDEDHSLATVRLVDGGLISARDLQAYSRVQNQVAKSAVLSFFSEDAATPQYLSFEFLGVSAR